MSFRNLLPLVVIICLSLSILGNATYSSASPFNKTTPKTSSTVEKRTGLSLLETLYSWQNQLRQEISSATRKLKNDHDVNAIFFLAAFSFLYGLIHALGPGHGKNIIMSCLLMEKRASIFKSIIAAALIAFGEMFSAIVVMLAVYFFAIGRLNRFTTSTTSLNMAIYTVIFAVGCILLLMRVNKHIRPRKQHLTSAPKQPKQSYLIAVLLGIIPCPGILILLSFMFTLKMFWTGIFLAMIAAFGMAITISCFGLLVVFLKKQSLKRVAEKQQRLKYVEATMEIVGALMIVVVSGYLVFSF